VWFSRRHLIALLVASVVIAVEPVKLAATTFSVVDVDAKRGEFLSEHFANSMARPELRVVTAQEIGALLGLERQKQLLGCGGQTNCMAELGNALGVSAVVVGTLARVGSRVQVSIKVIDSGSGTPLSIRSGKAETDEELADLVARFGKEMGDEVLVKLRPAAPSRGLRPYWWHPVLGGAVLGGIGISLFFVSRGTGALLIDGQHHDLATAQNAAGLATTQQTIGIVLMSLGVGGLLTGLAFLIFGGGS
jgi:TolB-like protein